MKTNITYYSRNELEDAARTLIRQHDKVLDIGPGIRPQWFVRGGSQLAIEPHSEYVTILKMSHPEIVVFPTRWEDCCLMGFHNLVDSVFALDVIEHCTKQQGQQLIKAMIEVAWSQIIIFTPIGFYPQSYAPGQKDRWGMNGGYWQTHRSGWTLDDFGEGWQVLACKGYHKYDQYDQKLETPIGAMYCIYTKE